MHRITVDDDTYETLVMIAWVRHQMNDRHFTVENIVAELVSNTEFAPDQDDADSDEWQRLMYEWNDVRSSVMKRHGYLRRLIKMR